MDLQSGRNLLVFVQRQPIVRRQLLPQIGVLHRKRAHDAGRVASVERIEIKREGECRALDQGRELFLTDWEIWHGTFEQTYLSAYHGVISEAMPIVDRFAG